MPTKYQIELNGEVIPGIIFDDGKVAGAFIKASPNMGYKIKRLVETDLQAELRKFDAGAYKPAPWHSFQPYRDLFHTTHLCRETDVPGMIEYVDPKSKLLTKIRAGRWLTQYMGNYIDADTIEVYAQSTGTPVPEIHFARTAEEMVWVYANGPSSCMAGEASRFSGLGGHHPVEAYAGFDLAVAYITEDGTPEGMPIARTLCWPDKKQFNRVYWRSRTNGVALERALQEQGFSHGKLSGARFSKITIGSSYLLLPYLDASAAIATDDYLQFRRDGWLGGSEQGRVPYSDADKPQAKTCAHAGCSNEVFISNLPAVQLPDGGTEHWCPDCVDAHTYRCAGSSYYYPIETPSVTIQYNGTRDKYSRSWFDDYQRRRLSEGGRGYRQAYVEIDGIWYHPNTTDYQTAISASNPLALAA
jgi:hypothetical protein